MFEMIIPERGLVLRGVAGRGARCEEVGGWIIVQVVASCFNGRSSNVGQTLNQLLEGGDKELARGALNNPYQTLSGIFKV